MDTHFLDGIDKIPKNIAIAIYGTGKYAEILASHIERIRPDVKIYCFFDSFNEGLKKGKPVFFADKISNLQEHFEVILVGSAAFRDEIHEKLQHLYYKNYYDVWFYPSMVFETNADINCTALKSYAKKNSDNTLYAFYDLGVSPYTFDAFAFMILAEFRRIALGKEKLHLFIIKDTQSDKWSWNIYNIIVPLSQFIPSLSDLSIAVPNAFIKQLLQSQDCFPTEYTIKSPVTAYTLKTLTKTIRQAGFKPEFRSTKKARQFVQLWLKKNHLQSSKLVTITLRQSPAYPDRNSSIDQWLLFADYLDKKGFSAVILKDTYSIFNPDAKNILDNYQTFNEASVNLELRLALYEIAYVNMGIPNGPMALCMYSNHIPYLVHMKLNNNYQETRPRYMAEMGLPVGSQFPFAKANQVLGWSYDDNFSTIKVEFEEFISKERGLSEHA